MFQNLEVMKIRVERLPKKMKLYALTALIDILRSFNESHPKMMFQNQVPRKRKEKTKFIFQKGIERAYPILFTFEDLRSIRNKFQRQIKPKEPKQKRHLQL